MPDIERTNIESLSRPPVYKCLSPQETVGLIQSKLSSLGIQTECVDSNNHRNGLYSKRVEIANPGIAGLHIGTNGKGVTEEYAAASAYGELMERLQNGLLLSRVQKIRLGRQILARDFPDLHSRLSKLGLLPDFIYAPDERTVSEANGADAYEEGVYPRGKHLRGDAIVLPFWNATKKRKVYVGAENLYGLCGSNGMCAGNTPAEAIAQGLNEVIERYVVKRLVDGFITPPDIPSDHFESCGLAGLIRNIEKEFACEVRIKDCSLGEAYPAIGLLFVDYINSRYCFKVGVDASPVIALERCLTEAFQGSNEIPYLGMNTDIWIRISEGKDRIGKENLQMYFRDGSGHLPHTVLNEQGSYAYQGFPSYAYDYDKYIRQLTDMLGKSGFDVLIRDVSYLGFPAFRVYVPGMSELNMPERVLANEEVVPWFVELHHPDDTREYKESALRAIGGIPFAGNPARSFSDADFWQAGNWGLFQAIANYRLGNFDVAKQVFEVLDKQERTQVKSLLYKFGKCCSSMRLNKTAHNIAESAFGKGFSARAVQLLENAPIAGLFKMTPCFDCEQCFSKAECSLIPLLRLSKLVDNKYQEGLPKQENLSSLFA